MTKSKRELIATLLVVGLVVVIVRLLIHKTGWRMPELDTRMYPSIALWVIFGCYWSLASLNSAPTQSSESRASTYAHQLLLLLALFLAVGPVPFLNASFLPGRLHVLAPLGLIIQGGFLLLAVWARRHLGRNWSAEVRIAVQHQLIRTGPYRFLRHPIYTAMLGMVFGTVIVSGQYHSLLGLGVLGIAYLRKTRLEERVLLQTFGPDYETYRRDSWALVPLVF